MTRFLATALAAGLLALTACRREPPAAAAVLAESIIAAATAPAATPETTKEAADQIGQLARIEPVTQAAVDALIVAAHSPHNEIREASLNRFQRLVRLGADETLVMQLRAAAFGALRSDNDSVRIAAMNFFFDTGLFRTDPVITQMIRWHAENDPADANQRRAASELSRLDRKRDSDPD